MRYRMCVWPLVLSTSVFCFTLTGPVSWWSTVIAALAFGFNAGLYLAAYMVAQKLLEE